MKRCKATTKAGRRCLNGQRPGTDFCAAHATEISSGELLATAAGALIGHALVPGLGLVLGGLAGHSFRNVMGPDDMTKKRVFISFDFDNDRVLRDFMLGQAKLPDSPFEVIDHSLKEAAPERNWEAKARAAIARSDVVIVMVGNATHRASGVLKEIAMARAAGVQVVQVIGYKDGDYTPVPNAGRLYAWNWPNLKKLLS
ncbi:TIR domain-containing protein [Rhodoferax sp.]|uniref:TIR domain-containing protein n=1 Tax=Rhodoferax sp. TaxID=50421 RepID=UPI001EC2452E|nr:TIR domain-containing protein [Rhodoferax sp.]MBT9508368.1 TIR domain-containing protein [Rhodoferax sp.]